jgi:hypothetical protein
MSSYAPNEQVAAQQKAALPHSEHSTDRRTSTGISAPVHYGHASLHQSPRSQSLLQMRQALDEGPRVQSQLALQRALNRTNTPPANEGEQPEQDARPEPAQLAAMPGDLGKPDEPPSTPVQRKPNATGMPDRLKAGVEQLSGLAMDDVRVHYNSSKPAAVQAHAYAQGSDIHLAPGQEQHLPHEAWHVVQQKQGRVKPTLQMKGVAINDDAGLEREADRFGAQAMTIPHRTAKAAVDSPARVANSGPPVQRRLKLDGKEFPRLNLSLKLEISRELAKLEYRPNGETFAYVEDDLILDDEEHDVSLAELVKHLIEHKPALADPPQTKFSGGPVSVHVTHTIPTAMGTFTSATQKNLPVAKGEHRRHVIGRHTLGRACDRSVHDPGVIDFVQKYGSGVAKNKVGQSWNISKDAYKITLKNEAYRVLQTHEGNLWVGDAGENTASGFFTGGLYQWFDSILQANEAPLLTDALDALYNIPVFGFAAEAMGEQKKVVAESLSERFSEVSQRGIVVKRGEGLAKFILEAARSCEIDLPKKTDPEYQTKMIDLFQRFYDSNQIFTDQTAFEFMELKAPNNNNNNNNNNTMDESKF